MGIQFPPIAFLYLLYFCIYIFFCTLVRSFIKLKFPSILVMIAKITEFVCEKQ